MKLFLLTLLTSLSFYGFSQRIEGDNITTLSVSNYSVSNLKVDTITYIAFTFKNLDKTTTPDYKSILFKDTLEYETFLNLTLRIMETRGETNFKTDNFSVYLRWATSNLCEIRAYGAYCYIRKCDIANYINCLN